MSTNLFFWNVRGLNDPRKHSPLSQWLLSHKSIFGVLLETHIKETQLPYVMSKACRDWKFCSNHNSDPDGRIILIWKDPADVRILCQSRQTVTCEISISTSYKFIFTAIYASCENEERQDLWVELLNIQQTLQLDCAPWILGGDLNQILHHAEHSSPSVNSLTPQMSTLRNVLTQLEVFDLRFLGPLFTWTNKSPSAPVAEKLDRLLVNQHWISTFPHSLATFLPPAFSDHSPCLIDLSVPLPTAGTRPFKFFNYLTKHHKFYRTLEDAWIQAGGFASDLSSLCYKFRKIKGALKELNRENFSNIQERVRETNILLNSVQIQALQNPTPALFQEEQDLHQKWCFLRQIEEAFFRQKSRINWLKEGDLNTTFFHRLVQVRASYNAIRSFSTPSGLLISDPLVMGMMAISHFQNLLSPTVMPTVICPSSWFQELITYRCPGPLVTSMILHPDCPEITRVMMKLNSQKAPGPDGLTSGFFKAGWEIVGREVTASVRTFFSTGFLPSATNATILSLVPKRPGATAVSDFRPISCCNTIYKVISKLLVHRLKPMLPDLILPNQTAFVQGRLLIENTVLASEIVHGYHRDRGPKRLVLKVDIAKAFDTINWDFILNCLASVGVPYLFIRWLRACICTPSFTVGYNGTVQGYFKSKRGLRQGDPLSPYLFVIAMNCLSLLLDKAAEEGKFGYHHKCVESKLTHLCFADDLLIFTEGSLGSVKGVLDIVRSFESKSGLALSITKTNFFTSGLPSDEIEQIKTETGLSHASLPIRYLGIPLVTKKLTMSDCEPLILSVKAKLNSWSSKTLSFAGRLLLINTVISGISNFWCATFTLPKKCIKLINSLCGAYLWKGTTEGTHTARVAWEEITHSKEEGGLAVRDLLTWNKACVMKLIWLLFFRAGSIWVAWFKKEILSGCVSNFWIIKESQKYSWSINKLIRLRDEVFPWIKTRIRNGATCRFWSDNWSPFGNLSTFLNLAPAVRMGISRTATLSDLNNEGNWMLPPARSDNQVTLYAYLSTITLTEDDDYVEWVMGDKKMKTYSTGWVYKELKHHNPLVPWRKLVWISWGVPKHSFLAWLFIKDRCPTRDRLITWGLQTLPNCLLCNAPAESRNHIFYDCPFTWSVWSSMAARCNFTPSRSWNQTITDLQQLNRPRPEKLLILLTWQCVLYLIWTERNNRLHRNAFRSADSISTHVISTIRTKIAAIRLSSPSLSSSLFAIWMA